MWELILSILSVVLSIAGPFIANWVQNKAADLKRERERREQIERDEQWKRELKEELRLEYRALGSKLLKGDKIVEDRFEEIMRGLD